MREIVHIQGGQCVTRSVPSSGRSSPTSTVLTQPVPITVIPISNSRESTSTIMKPPVEDTSQEPSLWILSQEPWTQLEPDLSVNSSDQTTSSSDKPEPVTTGLRDITLRVLSLLTQSSMSSERKLRLRLPSRFPGYPLPWWRYRIRYGNPPHLQDQRRVPRQNHGHLLHRAIPQGVRYRC